MRLVIDLQGAQGSSRHRGIGRYGMSLTQGLIRNGGEHEIFVALSDAFPDTIEPIRDALHGTIPVENILVWQAPKQVQAAESQNDGRRNAAQLLRESVLAQLAPDYVLVTSLFEGLGDDIITSVGELTSNVPTAVVLYDLIPLINRRIYLTNPVVETWYERKIGDIRNANLLLAISESARQEAVDYIGLDEQLTVNISTAADDHFTPAPVNASNRAYLAQALGLTRPFVMYTGGIDYRKNIEGLIEAFSRLPIDIRRQYQLAIVCSIQEETRERLLKLAETFGLFKDDLILTGYISEDDLLACYRSCKLFVFPSWHEGFGLPALEAMKCGRAVIVGNRSSLPEVVELDEALFDPYDIDAISGKIAEVLTNDDFRARLEQHGLRQAKKFSWDETAQRAWTAMEASHARAIENPKIRVQPTRRPRLAFVSPLPPEASGISDYSAELLPELARHYRIDVIVAQGTVEDPWVRGNCAIRDVAWFRAHAYEFDRILYQFGNSHFHTHMFDLLREHPGTIVLHDFFLSGVMAYRDWAAGADHYDYRRALLNAHGWPALIQYYKGDKPTDAMWTYPCNLQVLQDALGVIVHSDYSRQLARRWYGEDAASDWHLIPLLRQPLQDADRGVARRLLGIAPDDFVVCSFGMLGPTKLNDRLLAAWFSSPLAQDPHCHLIFVGQNEGGDFGTEILRAIRAGRSNGRVEITGWADVATFKHWLAAANAGVQLRSLSRGETSATVLDCMNAGLATIANANGSMAELPKDCIWLLEENFTNDDLVAALTTIWRDSNLRQTLGTKAKTRIRVHHMPRLCAAAYADAIEADYNKAAVGSYGVANALAQSDLPLSGTDWVDIAAGIARNVSPKPRLKRIYVDVSEVSQRDATSGVNRVVRSILSQWLQKPPAGWIVEPVYAQVDAPGYRHARRFSCRILGIWEGALKEDWVEPFPGDVFVGLDVATAVATQQQATLHQWRRRGIVVKMMIYDLLPLYLSDRFVPGDTKLHHAWLQMIAQFDGAICVSRSVADELQNWLEHYGPKRERPFAIDWFRLGADTENGFATLGLPIDAEQTLAALRATPSFVAIGTLEPRKGHRQMLAAFENLWADGVGVNLVFVGKQGWMMEEFAAQLRAHAQAGSQLFWLEAISDEYLDRVYAACSCLLAASEGEGAGLPIIEARRHGIPVLARDLPVFREVGGDNSSYFLNSNEPAVIEQAVRNFLEHPRQQTNAENTVWQTWEQSAHSLAAIVLGQKSPYRQWQHDGILRLWGNDIRMNSQVGKPHHHHTLTDGSAGFLVYGPHLPVGSGTYQLTAAGTARHLTGTEWLDVASNRGEQQLMRVTLSSEAGRWRVIKVLQIEHAIPDFEVRLWVNSETDLSLESIELKRI